MSTKNLNDPAIIAIEEIPPKLDELKALVNNPSEIDNTTTVLGIPPFLLNLYLATSTNLSFLNIGLNEAVYIPRQITERDGGRKSQYLLRKGETTQAGVFMADSGMMLRYVTRLTGDSEYAQTGDVYREQYLTRDEKLIYEADGTLEIVDITKGIGKYTLVQTKTPQYAQVSADPEVVMSTLSGSTYYKLHQGFQSCINYNIGSFDMFSTGSTPGKAHIIEVLDLNNDDCENTEITLTPVNISFTQTTMTPNEISNSLLGSTLSFSNWTQNTSSNYPLSMDVECLTETGGGKKNALFVETLINEKRLTLVNKDNVENQYSGIVLTNNNNEFVCENFDGECNYQVFNVFGSLIEEGKTVNSKTNYLKKVSSGTYIIRVTDAKGNISSNKIIITE